MLLGKLIDHVEHLLMCADMVCRYLAEMEVISKEFESTMEQNTRLLHQLSDKDETTTKLMSDVRSSVFL